jgi:hypothetical protein
MQDSKQVFYIVSVAIILVAFALYLLSSNRETTKFLSFKECKIDYHQYSKGEIELYEGHFMTNEMEHEQALRRLGFCLCKYYMQTKDTSVNDKIIELYKRKYNYFPSYTKQERQPVDSIVKYKEIVFDTVLLID